MIFKIRITHYLTIGVVRIGRWHCGIWSLQKFITYWSREYWYGPIYVIIRFRINHDLD